MSATHQMTSVKRLKELLLASYLFCELKENSCSFPYLYTK